MTNKLPRVRQLVVAALDLKQAEDILCDTLDVPVGFRDDLSGFGLENILLPIGDTFLEVVSPITNPPEKSAAGRHIARCGGDCGYMVIIQVEKFADTLGLIESHSLRRVWDIDRENHGVYAKAAHLHPLDVPGAILSLDEMDPVQGWQWCGPNWQEKVNPNSPAVKLIGATFSSANHEWLAQRWNQPLGVASNTQGEAEVLTLGDTTLKFEPSATKDTVPHRLAAFQLETKSADASQEILAKAKKHNLATGEDHFTAYGVRFELVHN